jgi:acyl carrier protein
MEYPEIEQKVKEIFASQLNIDIAKINLNSHLFNDLSMDSFGAIETVYALEEKFDLKIPEADIDKAKTIKDIVDHIARQLEKKPA